MPVDLFEHSFIRTVDKGWIHDAKIVPSGTFTYQGHPGPNMPLAYSSWLGSPLKLSNGLALGLPPIDTREERTGHDAAVILAKRHKAPVVSHAAILDYGQAMQEMASHIQLARYAFMVAVLRGGATPMRQLRVLGLYAPPVEDLYFTRGSSGQHDDYVVSQLRDWLPLYAPHGGTVKVAFIDAAIGGHSALALGRLIAAANTLSGLFLQATLHLLHQRDSTPAEFYDGQILQQSSKVEVRVALHPILNLLVEDRDACIGLLPAPGKGRRYAPITEGTLIIEGPRAATAIHCSDLPTVVDVAIADSITESLLTDPRAKLERDVWQLYARRQVR